MYYSLVTGNLPDDLNPEGVASALERAAEQLRDMPSLRASHSLELKTSVGLEVSHGVVFTPRDPEYRR